MKNTLPILLAIIILGGCAQRDTYRSPEFAPSEAGKVAIIPFTTLSGEPNGGMVISRMLENELRRMGKMTIIPQAEISAKLVEVEGELLAPTETGKLLTADTLITGQVNEYRYKQGVEEEPVISLTVQIVDSTSGKVLYTSSLSRVGRMSWLREDSLGRLAQEIARELTRDILKGK